MKIINGVTRDSNSDTRNAHDCGFTEKCSRCPSTRTIMLLRGTSLRHARSTMAIRRKTLTQFANEGLPSRRLSPRHHIFPPPALLTSFPSHTNGRNECLHLVHHEDKPDHISTSTLWPCSEKSASRISFSLCLDAPQYLN